MLQVTYLGHVFCAAGVTPDETKVKACGGMANTKQCYRGTAILRSGFLLSEVHLSLFEHCNSSAQTDTEGQPIYWTTECEAAFRTLKSKLTSAPVLMYPRFDKRASQFVLQTDANAVVLYCSKMAM